MSARPRGGYFPAAKTPEHIVSRARGKDTTFDRLVARAARELLPSALTEQAWLRRTHDDIPMLGNWQLRRELRILTWYLESPSGQREFNRAWFLERVERLRTELVRRERGGAR